MRLSIIVPVYNVEKHIAGCIQSLLNQDLNAYEYEIIIVNDGSKDNSIEIVEKFKLKHSNISVLNKKTTYQIYKKYAAIIIVALGIIGYLASDYQLNQIEKQNQIAQETANKEIDAKINKATFIIDNPLPSITLTVTKQNGDFHIVAGAFRIKENCDKKLEQLQKLGYNARKIGANKYGLHQVVYSSYNSRTEAQKELYKIRESHNQNAWLLVQKLK